MSLVPCPACNRHVRAGECAFCGALVEAESTRVEPGERMSRAARAAIGLTAAAALAAAAATATACGDKSSNTVVNDPSGGGGGAAADPDGGQQVQEFHRHPGGGGQNMPYGAPPADGRLKRVV